ncbi:hypothetical protein Q7P35_004001 [Cladosporium inversicolor]
MSFQLPNGLQSRSHRVPDHTPNNPIPTPQSRQPTTQPNPSFVLKQLPLNPNNKHTIPPRMRNLRKNISRLDLRITKKCLIMLINTPLHQPRRRSRIGAAATRNRPLKTRLFGGAEQVLVFGALERIGDGFFAFFGEGDDERCWRGFEGGGGAFVGGLVLWKLSSCDFREWWVRVEMSANFCVTLVVLGHLEDRGGGNGTNFGGRWRTGFSVTYISCRLRSSAVTCRGAITW